MHCCCHDWWSRELRLTSACVCVSLYSDDKSGDEKSDDDQDDNSRPMTQEELRIRMRKKVAGAREPVNHVSSNVSRAFCTFAHSFILIHFHIFASWKFPPLVSLYVCPKMPFFSTMPNFVCACTTFVCQCAASACVHPHMCDANWRQFSIDKTCTCGLCERQNKQLANRKKTTTSQKVPESNGKVPRE